MQTSSSKPSHVQKTPGVSAAMVSANAFVTSMQHPTDGNICQGWLLKKRRKKMQGVPANARVLRAANDMESTIKELEAVLQDVSALDVGKKHKKHYKEKDKDHHKEKDHPNKDIFGLFHRKVSGPGQTPPVTPSPSTGTNEFIAEMQSSPLPPSSTVPVYERLQAAVATLRAQHAALLNVLESTSTAMPSQVVNSPLARVNEMLAFDNHSNRHSIGTIESLSPSLWYDAEDGAEEFVLTAEPTETEQAFSDQGDESEEEVVDITASDDSEDEAPTPTKERSDDGDSKHKVVIRRTKLPSPMVGDDGSLLAVLRKNVGKVTRASLLQDIHALMAIVPSKDLSTVSFPVSFNEPISILQKFVDKPDSYQLVLTALIMFRMAEDLEYFDLLGLAAASADPVERICFIAAFAVSGYACSLHRASRKPFNPMLGETFEDSRMNYISEKVSHHPAIMACHASGQGWEYWATSAAESKFWGRSMEIKNNGTTHVKLAGSHYKWNKPSSFVRNLLVGEKYLAHEGELIVKDSTTGHRCVITFKEGGYWGPSRAVAGAVYGPSSSSVLAKLDGTWNEGISLQLDPKGCHLRVLWRAHSFPPHAHEYYGFTSFAMSLNEITPDMEGRLCPTDSRLRPDQRAMEEGRMDFADDEKARLEAAQRVRRKAREDRGEKWVPKWFEPHPTDADEWVYKGGYWEARAAKKWGKLEQLW
ncbi:hypothetical protein FRC01_001441 [Tulasnella sp. 417]|nr:hypothetical protein FRC01_001441 [Tulasnella sp. 417]